MAGGLDNLRQEALEEQEVKERYEELIITDVQSDQIFGMSAVERMFISIGCFLLTSLGGFFLLLLMDKIAV